MKRMLKIKIAKWGEKEKGWYSAMSDNPQGRVYNLDEITRDLIIRYKDIFHKEFYCREPTARWSKYRWKTMMAFYTTGINRISVNCVLDSRKVPLMVVEYILFHEMVHAFLKQKVEKMNFDPYPDHGVHFRWLMEKYEHYQQAKEWLGLNWNRLLRPEKKKKESPEAREVGAEQVISKKSPEVNPEDAR